MQVSTCFNCTEGIPCYIGPVAMDGPTLNGQIVDGYYQATRPTYFNILQGSILNLAGKSICQYRDNDYYPFCPDRFKDKCINVEGVPTPFVELEVTPQSQTVDYNSLVSFNVTIRDPDLDTTRGTLFVKLHNIYREPTRDEDTRILIETREFFGYMSLLQQNATSLQFAMKDSDQSLIYSVEVHRSGLAARRESVIYVVSFAAGNVWKVVQVVVAVILVMFSICSCALMIWACLPSSRSRANRRPRDVNAHMEHVEDAQPLELGEGGHNSQLNVLLNDPNFGIGRVADSAASSVTTISEIHRM